MSGSDLNLKPTQPSAIKDVGTAIRQGRESALISREELAQRLHMGCEQLEALEQGELPRLPEPVFIKAMVRRHSSHLGLDADALVQTLGTLSASKPTRPTPGPTRRDFAPRKKATLNPLPLLALAGIAGLAVVVWSNASEL